MPTRSFSATNAYRYGFNGKENDPETETQDYGFRIYNPAIGKFLSVDPLTGSYPELTPYQFASNRPIDGIDIDGLEFGWFVDFIADGLTKLGMPRAAGFVNSYGHSLLPDPIYNSFQTGKKVTNNQYVEAVKDMDPTGITRIPDLYRTTVKAIKGDKYAQGQLLGMLPAFYGGFKSIKGGVRTPLPVEVEILKQSQSATKGLTYNSKALVTEGIEILTTKTKDDLAYLKAEGAEAVYFTTGEKTGSILLKEGASQATILEEVLHHNQKLKYGEEYFLQNRNKLEVEAQNLLLEYGKKLNWTKEELQRIEKAKLEWEKKVANEKNSSQ